MGPSLKMDENLKPFKIKKKEEKNLRWIKSPILCLTEIQSDVSKLIFVTLFVI